MKKFFFGLALFAATTFGALAQNPGSSAPQTCPEGKQQCDKIKGECPKEKGNCEAKQKCNPFENLDLTAEQKIKLDELKAKCAAERDTQKLEGDKAKAENKGQKMLEEVKKILTPEQYVKFLENVYVYGASKGDKAMHQGQKSGKHQMAHNKGKSNKHGKAGKDRRDGNRQNKHGQSRQTSASATI